MSKYIQNTLIAASIAAAVFLNGCRHCHKYTPYTDWASYNNSTNCMVKGQVNGQYSEELCKAVGDHCAFGQATYETRFEFDCVESSTADLPWANDDDSDIICSRSSKINFSDFVCCDERYFW